MSNKSIPVPLKDLLVKLYFLSLVDKGTKANLSDLSVVDSNSWWGALVRSFKGESRKTTIALTEKIIGETIEAINTFSTSEFLPIIITRLAKARQGIHSLQTTYSHDPNTWSRLCVILDEIDLQLSKHQNIALVTDSSFDLQAFFKKPL